MLYRLKEKYVCFWLHLKTSSPKGNDAHLRAIIQSEKKWKHQFFRRLRAANSVVRGRIWPIFKLIQALMYVIITCKYEKDPIKNRELDLMFMKHYAPNRCLYIKVTKLRTGVGSAETSYLQNCSVKLFKEHFKVQICKMRLFEKNKTTFFLIFTN